MASRCNDTVKFSTYLYSCLIIIINLIFESKNDFSKNKHRNQTYNFLQYQLGIHKYKDNMRNHKDTTLARQVYSLH